MSPSSEVDHVHNFLMLRTELIYPLLKIQRISLCFDLLRGAFGTRYEYILRLGHATCLKVFGPGFIDRSIATNIEHPGI